MPPPRVTREIYCYPRRRLIVSSGGLVVYHSKGFLDYIPKFIQSVQLSVHLSVCTTIFKRSNE